MADQPTTTTQPKSSFDDLVEKMAGNFGFQVKKTKDPLDKTVTESRYVNLGGANGRTVKAKPLGVETGYVAPYRGQRISSYDQADAAFGADYSGGVDARYDATDLDLFAGLSPESMWSIQQGLMRAGLIDQAPKGIFDDITATAMSKVLSYANKRGLLWQDALDEYAAAGDAAGLGAGGGPRRVFTPQLSNPDDLRRVFKQAAYDLTGGSFMDDSTYERMVSGYQGAELAAQRAQFDAAVSGAEVTDAPSAQAFAQTDLKAADPSAVEAKRFADYGGVLESLLGGA